MLTVLEVKTKQKMRNTYIVIILDNPQDTQKNVEFFSSFNLKLVLSYLENKMPAVIANEPNHFSMSFQCEILPVFWMTYDITVCCQVPPSDSVIFILIKIFLLLI